jgi:hypothetical protein
MTQYRRKQALGVFARECERIGMAHTGRHVSQKHLAGLGTVEFDLLDFEWLACLPGYSCA